MRTLLSPDLVAPPSVGHNHTTSAWATRVTDGVTGARLPRWDPGLIRITTTPSL